MIGKIAIGSALLVALLAAVVALQPAEFTIERSVQIDAPPELHSARVPRTLLQPLMENALKCSAEPNQSLVAVRVTIRREGDDLSIRVRDRGPGCSASARSVGLANITARIQTLYGNDYGISLTEADEGGAEVTVRLPLRVREAV